MRSTLTQSRRSLAAVNVAWLLLAVAAALVGIAWGDDIARFKRVSQALDQLERCETDGTCAEAWDALDQARGRR